MHSDLNSIKYAVPPGTVTTWLGELTQTGGPQRGFLWATTCTTVCEFVVHHYGWHRADAKFLGPLCHRGLIHVQNTDLA